MPRVSRHSRVPSRFQGAPDFHDERSFPLRPVEAKHRAMMGEMRIASTTSRTPPHACWLASVRFLSDQQFKVCHSSRQLGQFGHHTGHRQLPGPRDHPARPHHSHKAPGHVDRTTRPTTYLYVPRSSRKRFATIPSCLMATAIERSWEARSQPTHVNQQATLNAHRPWALPGLVFRQQQDHNTLNSLEQA